MNRVKQVVVLKRVIDGHLLFLNGAFDIIKKSNIVAIYDEKAEFFMKMPAKK